MHVLTNVACGFTLAGGGMQQTLQSMSLVILCDSQENISRKVRFRPTDVCPAFSREDFIEGLCYVVPADEGHSTLQHPLQERRDVRVLGDHRQPPLCLPEDTLLDVV